MFKTHKANTRTNTRIDSNAFPKTRFTKTALAKSCLLLFSCALTAHVLSVPEPGSADLSFGYHGTSSLSVGHQGKPTQDVIEASTIDHNGNLLVVGTNYDEGGSRKAGFVARYTADGELDSSFANNGLFEWVSSLNFRGVKVDSAGRIVISGQVEADLSYNLVIRLNPDGTMDNTFSEDGQVFTPRNSHTSRSATGYGLLIDENDNIITTSVTSNGTDNDFTLLKYTSEGILDETFGSDGMVQTNISGHDRALSMTFDMDNNILVAGATAMTTSGDSQLFIAKYLSSGEPDTSFGENGTVVNTLSGTRAYATTIAVNGHNQLMVGGYADNDAFVLSYTANGEANSAFGENGLARIDLATDFDQTPTFNWLSMALYSDDKPVLSAGVRYSVDGGGIANISDMVLYRLQADGQRDATFGANGVISIDANGAQNSSAALSINANDSINVAGMFVQGETVDGMLARINHDGSLDVDFAIGGYVVSNLTHELIAKTDDIGLITLPLANKQVIIAGLTHDKSVSTDNDVVLALVDHLGQPVSAFGGANQDGMVVTAVGFAVQTLKAVLDPQENILVVATGAESQVAILRYQADGQLDANFGDNGMTTLNLGEEGYIADVALMAEVDRQTYRLLLGVGFNATDTKVATTKLMAFNHNGQLDVSFASEGTGSNSGELVLPHDQLEDIFLDDQNRIGVVGQRQGMLATQRLTAQGQIDPRFADAGYHEVDLMAHAALEGYDSWRMVAATMGDTPLVVINVFNEGQPFGRNTLLKLNQAGQVDDNFQQIISTTDWSNISEYVNDMAVDIGGNLLISHQRYQRESLCSCSVLLGSFVRRFNSELQLDGLFGLNAAGDSSLADYGYQDISLDALGHIYTTGKTLDNTYFEAPVFTNLAISRIGNGSQDNHAPTGEVLAPWVSSTSSGPVVFDLIFAGADTIALSADQVTLVATNDVMGFISIENGTSATPTVVVSNISGNGAFSIEIAPAVAIDNAGNQSVAIESSAVTVANNSAPVISGTPVTVINQDEQYSFTPTATDADAADSLVFSISNSPSWAAFDAATGALTGITSSADVGTYADIVITVTDNSDATASIGPFSIEVKAVSAPPPPIPTTPSSSGSSGGGAMHYYLWLMLLVGLRRKA